MGEEITLKKAEEIIDKPLKKEDIKKDIKKEEIKKKEVIKEIKKEIKKEVKKEVFKRPIPIKAIDIFPKNNVSENAISFDIYFNRKVFEGKYAKHHRLPLLSFLKKNSESVNLTFEEFEKIFIKY